MISVLLTAYKEPRTIGQAMKAFLDQISKKDEVLVACPDAETKAVIMRYAKKYKQVKYVKDSGKGKPTALNILFQKAKGDILILSDGDVYISPNAVKEIIEPFKDTRVGAVTGHPIPINSRNTRLGFWAHLLTDAGAHQRRMELQSKGKFLVCSGYLMAMRAKIINSIPENALSDDAVITHLIYKKGFSIKYAPKSIVNVKFPTNISDWIKQKRRSAGGYNQMKYLIGEKDEMRSFFKESSKISWALSYPKNIREVMWTLMLIPTRIYLWVLIFIDINLKKKSFEKLWVRVESTK